MTDAKIWEYDRSKKLDNFDFLLKEMQKLSEKEKNLWKEIYDNAISDRNSADVLYTNLYMDIQRKPVDERFASYTLASKLFNDILTRMERSNAQLITLASMIREVREKEEPDLGDNLLEELDTLNKKVG